MGNVGIYWHLPFLKLGSLGRDGLHSVPGLPTLTKIKCGKLGGLNNYLALLQALMVKMSIKVTPTFVLYRDGEKVHSHGGVNERNLHRAIQAHLLESEAGYGQTPAAAEDSDDD